MSGTTKQDHQAERLQAIRLRYSINTHLEDQGITTPTAVGATTGLTAAEVVRLLTRRQWREGDVAALKAIADRLGLDVPLKGLGLPMR
jgi:predicted transcriptional regulator